MFRQVIAAAGFFVFLLVGSAISAPAPDDDACYRPTLDQLSALKIDCRFVKDADGCYKQISCTQTCMNSELQIQKSEGSVWFEDFSTKQCTCEEVRLPFGILVDPIFPGMKWARVKQCRDYGCRHPDTDAFIASGRKIYLPNKRSECSCVSGTDPRLADDYTLYHLQCRSKADARSCVLDSQEHTYGTVKEMASPDGSRRRCECKSINDSKDIDWECKELGCRNRNWDFLPPNSQVVELGRTCTCIEGVDPLLEDTSSLYYLKCA